MQIRKDQYYLLKTYFIEALVLASLCLIFHKFISNDHGLNLSLVIFLPFGIIFGLMVASFIHNASHGNVGGKFVNRLAGEFCGTWVLYGFTNFVMIHSLHHKYSDRELDPVNPQGMSFLTFLFAPMRYMIRVAQKWLNKVHGHNINYSRILFLQTILFHINLILRISLWFMLLGPGLFLCFYLPSLLANYAVHAHINFVCHNEKEDGSVEILNLNHNVYYKFVNFVTAGGYFHKNHHLDLKLFNPMKARSKYS